MPAKLLSMVLLLALCAAAMGQVSVGDAAPGEARDANINEFKSRVEELIRELGDEQFEVREAAAKGLASAGSRARPYLELATKSTDPEVAGRAQAILDALPKLSHTLVDALGQPIPLATVTVKVWTKEPGEGIASTAVKPSQKLTVTSEEDGRVGIPAIDAGNVAYVAIVHHSDYGRGQCAVESAERNPVIQLPLVRRGTEAHRRAVSGQVVNPDGKPVAGAVIHCTDIRTPGMGLIEGKHPRGEALSGDDGRFTLYLPNENRRSDRGVLVPANSRYGLRVTVPGDDAYFPIAGRYTNVEPARIELPRVTRVHRFRFEAAGGGWLIGEEQLRNVHVQYEGQQDGERMLINLQPAAVVGGRKLRAGKYVAESFAGGQRVQYLPLIVTDQSPEELSFLLPHPVTYRGRVVHGATGEGIAGALVMGWNSTARNNLALLTADDWRKLRDVPSNPPLDHPAIQRLREFYGVQGLVRTDREGRFEITRQPDQEYYGLLAFDEDFVPFKVRVGSLKADENHCVDAGEFPLFPAGKIVVRPVFTGERLAVSPRWFPAESGQPEWFDRFQAAGRSSEREFEYVHWLTLNELQPIYVPAGIRLNVRFESPYDDQWAPALVEGIQMEHRASKEVGDVQFAANISVAVRVVDRRGKPVEGIPVRQKYIDDNAWSVAHNTDSEGLARFHAPPNSEGQVRVSDMPGPKEERFAENLLAKFKVGRAASDEPVTITVTESQAELLLGKANSK